MPRPRKRSRSAQRGHFRFASGPTDLDRADAISLYAPEVPLTPGWKLPSDGQVAGDDGREYLAKLSLSTDPFPVVRAEAAGIDLARRVGVPVPHTEVVRSVGRDVLLVDRFDRPGHQDASLARVGADSARLYGLPRRSLVELPRRSSITLAN